MIKNRTTPLAHLRKLLFHLGVHLFRSRFRLVSRQHPLVSLGVDKHGRSVTPEHVGRRLD